MRGNVAPSYQHALATNPEKPRRRSSRVRSLSSCFKIIDHYTYAIDAEETVDGVDCWRIAFTPKPDMPYENREEKVLNNTSGHIWAVQGRLLRSSVTRARSCIRFRLRGFSPRCSEMHFRFDAARACPIVTTVRGKPRVSAISSTYPVLRNCTSAIHE